VEEAANSRTVAVLELPGKLQPIEKSSAARIAGEIRMARKMGKRFPADSKPVLPKNAAATGR
jgi:hypothetical protein